jgi:signal transduction histidine kinase/CheY-like chemotaxis protein
VAGVSPRLPFDDVYRGFYDLLGGAVTAVMANARAYEEERKRAEVLAELDRAKTTFFSNVSHEFRTPLTLMLGPLEEVLAQENNGHLAPKDWDQLKLAHRNSLRLLKLVNTLLDFSRIEAGRVQALYEPVDLSALTQDLASVFRSVIEKARVRFLVDCPPLPNPVYVDRGMWEKVVFNLLSNAFKFTFHGEICATLQQGHGSVVFSVSDTGIGIPPTEIPHLFERFHRVEGARGRTHEGTGIGLALVAELVKLHGGTVHVESEMDVGSRFFVTLPYGSTHLPPEKLAPPSTAASLGPRTCGFPEEAARWLPEGISETGTGVEKQGEPLGGTPSSGRILLADDNADMRLYLQNLLAPDYEVDAVTNGAQALRAIQQRVPDLVISDVMMPELDGFALLAELRKDKRTQQVPVLLLSARAGEESRIEGLDAGADDYLVKPFSALEFLARVRANIELAQLRQMLSKRAKFDSRFSLTRMSLAYRHGISAVISIGPMMLSSQWLGIAGPISKWGKWIGPQ